MPNNNSNPETFYIKAQKSFDAMGNEQYTDGTITPGLARFTSQVGNGVPLLSKPPVYPQLPKLPPVKK